MIKWYIYKQTYNVWKPIVTRYHPSSEDWISETNPITEGDGSEVYARHVAL